MSAGLFGRLPEPGRDPILSGMAAFRADPRPDKIDLGVGIYRDASGRTPVLAAVKAAEARLLETQHTKAYTSMRGDPEFIEAFGRLALDRSPAAAGFAGVATPGGTAAIHHGAGLLQAAAPGMRVWLPQPSWANHAPLLADAGLRPEPCRYCDPASGALDPDGLLADLGRAVPGDAVLLQGACHNPTGLDPAPALWAALADICARRGLLPFVDVAYQGLGDGLREDMAGPLTLLDAVPEAILALSGSKTFGLYRERVGLLLVKARPADRALAQAALEWRNRLSYTFPPDHGAAVVTTILAEPALERQWAEELGAMRARLTALRGAFAAELGRHADRAARVVADGRGMFARLPVTPAQVTLLRDRDAIHIVPDGRVNIAGLTEAAIPRVAEALARAGL